MKHAVTKCTYCKRKSVITITKPLCKNHFTHYFERKVKKAIKKYGLINPKERIVVLNSGDASSATALYLMKRFYPKVYALNINRINKKSKNKITENYNKIVISQNIDDEAERIMTNLAQDNKRELARLGPKVSKRAKPLYLCTQNEVKIYAKIKKLKFKPDKNKKSDMKKFLDDFDKIYTGIKHSIVSSYLEFLPLIKKRLLKTKE